MPSLMGFALAGAAQGLGDSIVQRAQEAREAALRQQDREWELEDDARAREHEFDVLERREAYDRETYNREREDALADTADERAYEEGRIDRRAAALGASIFDDPETGPIFRSALEGAGVDPVVFEAISQGESAGDWTITERAGYTPARAREVFGSRVAGLSDADLRNPQVLFNTVYGGRLGNNQEGDGYRYRGRGLIQLTGRSNYERYAELTGHDIVSDPDLMIRDPQVAADVAAAYLADRTRDTGDPVADLRAAVAGGYDTHGFNLNIDGDRARYEALRLMVDPDVPEGAREIARRGLGLGASEPPELTNITWVDQGDGTQVRMGFNSATQRMEPILGQDGEPVTQRREEDEPEPSEGLQYRVEQELGFESEQIAPAVIEEVMRVMREDDLSEDAARRKVLDAMVYETTTVEGGGFLRSGAEVTNRVRRGDGDVEGGTWTGIFDYGNDAEDQPEAPAVASRGGPETPAMPGEPDAPEGPSGMPSPRTQAEYEALPSGTRYLAPDGQIRVKS